MPCLAVLVVLLFPRVILVLMFFLSNYLERAYHHSYVIPLLGFIFLPITTIVYAWLMNNGYSISGVNALILIVAVLLDAGSHGAGWRSRNR